MSYQDDYNKRNREAMFDIPRGPARNLAEAQAEWANERRNNSFPPPQSGQSPSYPDSSGGFRLPAWMELRTATLAGKDPNGIRQEYLKHEGALKNMGLIFYLAAACLALASVLCINAWEKDKIVIGWFLLGVGFVCFVLGFGIRGVKPWVRIPAGVVSGLSCFFIPVGLLIGGYTFYLTFSKGGSVVFSSDYQKVIQATKQMKPKASVLTRIVRTVWLLFLCAVALAVWASWIQ